MNGVEFRESVELAPLTTLGVGGPARYFVDARDESTLVEACDWARRHGVPLRVLGGGSNIVVSDAGFNGLVVRIGSRGIEHSEQGKYVTMTAAAGEPWDALVELSVRKHWAGFECLSGIPGLVGATPIQNVGAYGQEVSETITSVRVYDRTHSRVVTLTAADCRFRYRDSLFKSIEPERYVVLGVSYRLLRGGAPRLAYPELLREVEESAKTGPTLGVVREAILRVRRRKSMVLDVTDDNRRSCGSFFVNPIVPAEVADRVAQTSGSSALPNWPQADGRIKLSAAWLIEQAGFSRGQRAGPVGLSSRHTLALVCHEHARAFDVVALARHIRARVEQRFGIRLVPEPTFWGFGSLDGELPDERNA